MKNASYAQLIRGLDRFYEDYRNEAIPIVFGLRVVTMEMRGESAELIDRIVRGWRGAAINRSTPTPTRH
jgi:hypothetical protein